MSLSGGVKRIIDDAIDRIVHVKKRLVINHDYWRVDQFINALPKVYIYDLPDKFKPSHRLSLVSETYFALYDFFRLYCQTDDPQKAEYFFVPLNIIQYQFRNENPYGVLKYLNYFDPLHHNHLLIALGDYSQRSKKNHFGHAYLETYTWLNDFVLLALESTSDLIPEHDIGIIPYNTLSTKPEFNKNKRPYLYSFIGEISHSYLPNNHIRNQMGAIPLKKDIFIASRLNNNQRKELINNYYTQNDYELVARNSLFTLAPAGFGRWTYRFFQAIQWGSIPVLLSDDYIKPFEDSIPYDDFCITIPENNLHHFTQTGFFYKLCNRLKLQIKH